MLATAHRALPGTGELDDADADDALRARADVDAYLQALGWTSAPDTPARRMLADALVALRRLGHDAGPGVFAPYAEVADGMASRELDTIDPTAPRERMVEHIVVGTVVFEAAFVALRRLAQANHSARRFGQHRPDSA